MTIPLAGLNGHTLHLPPEALQAFKATFKGTVLAPDDAAYDDKRGGATTGSRTTWRAWTSA